MLTLPVDIALKDRSKWISDFQPKPKVASKAVLGCEYTNMN